MNYRCLICGRELGKRNTTYLCEKCRVKKWHQDHKKRVDTIKKKWLKNNPEKRKLVVFKDNNVVGKDRKKKWYDSLWFDGKKTILIKTHPFCGRCGKEEMLQVHHRDGQGLTSKIQNNDWSNLIVLCFPCHMEVHRKKEKPYYVGK